MSEPESEQERKRESKCARHSLFVVKLKRMYIFMRYYDVYYNWCVIFHFTHDYDMWDVASSIILGNERNTRCKNNTLARFGPASLPRVKMIHIF